MKFIQLRVALVGLFTIIIFYNLSSRAGGETSGGGIIKQFQQMSPEQALESNTFFKRYSEIYLPNLSKSVSPKKLCTNGQKVFVTETMQFCAMWAAKVRQPVNGKSILPFKYRHQASNFAKSTNGVNEYYCAQEIIDFPSIPVRENIEDCISWIVKANSESLPKTFATLREAEAYEREHQGKTSSPLCIQWGKKIQSVSTKYRVDFYSKPADEKVGDHKYELENCN